MPKKITLDELARRTQAEFVTTNEKVDKGFAALREDVGTLRKDVGTLREDVGTLREDLGILREDMDAGFSEVKHTLDAIRGDLRDFKVRDAEFYDLRARVERLENKMGIAK